MNRYKILRLVSKEDSAEFTLMNFPAGDSVTYNCTTIEEYYLALTKLKQLLNEYQYSLKVDIDAIIGSFVDRTSFSKSHGLRVIKIGPIDER